MNVAVVVKMRFYVCHVNVFNSQVDVDFVIVSLIVHRA